MTKITVKLSMILSALFLLASPSFASETLPLVLFDQGHNQRFLIEDKGELQLSGLAEIIRSQGSRVSATKERLSDATLEGVAALVVSGPFETLLPSEVEAIVRFVEKGGRLAAMLHIGQPLAGLLKRLDLAHANAVLHERRNIIDIDINFRVQDLSATPLFAGIDHFSTYGAWALNGGDGSKIIARTSPVAWVDLNSDRILSEGDAIGAFGVVATGSLGSGSFVVFGDDAIFQNRYLDEDNKKLAVNLGTWLSGH